MKERKPARRREPPRRYDRASGGFPRAARGPEDYDLSARLRAQARRKHRRRLLAFFYVTLFLIVLAAAAALSLTVLFRISSVRVAGTSRYSAEQIGGASGIREGDNLFLIRPRQAAESIRRQLPYLGEITVSRRFPAEVEIHVAEEPVCGVLPYEKSYLVMGEDGRALEIAAKAPQGSTLLKGLNVRKAQTGYPVEFDQDSAAELVGTVTQAFRKNGLGKIDSIDFSKSTRILAVYDGRVTIDLGLPSDLDYKIRFAQSLLKNNIKPSERGTLDMSVAPDNDKAYFDPSGALSSGASSAK